MSDIIFFYVTNILMDCIGDTHTHSPTYGLHIVLFVFFSLNFVQFLKIEYVKFY